MSSFHLLFWSSLIYFTIVWFIYFSLVAHFPHGSFCLDFCSACFLSCTSITQMHTWVNHCSFMFHKSVRFFECFHLKALFESHQAQNTSACSGETLLISPSGCAAEQCTFTIEVAPTEFDWITVSNTVDKSPRATVNLITCLWKWKGMALPVYLCLRARKRARDHRRYTACSTET